MGKESYLFRKKKGNIMGLTVTSLIHLAIEHGSDDG